MLEPLPHGSAVSVICLARVWLGTVLNEQRGPALSKQHLCPPSRGSVDYRSGYPNGNRLMIRIAATARSAKRSAVMGPAGAIGKPRWTAIVWASVNLKKPSRP